MVTVCLDRRIPCVAMEEYRVLMRRGTEAGSEVDDAMNE